MSIAANVVHLTDPAARLVETVRHAVRTNPRSMDAAKDALVKTVRRDADLLWVMFEPHRQAVLDRLLGDTAASLRLSPHLGGGPSTNGSPVQRDVVAASQPTQQRPPRVGNMQAVAAVAQKTLLDTFRIGRGQSIGDATPAEALMWAAGRERDTKFVRLLVQNLPPDQPIRKYRTAEAADALYMQVIHESEISETE